MNRHDRGNLRFLISFSLVVTATSLLFSLLSWGRGALGPPDILHREIEILIHMGEHVALGALAALPTRRIVTILAGGFSAALIDMDHAGSIIGLPTDGRASHTIPFAVVVFIIIFLLARKGMFGRRIPALLASLLAVSSFLAHLALDAVESGGVFPIWMPFSNKLVFIPPWGGVMLEIWAVVLVWVGAKKWRYQGQPERKQSQL